MQCPLFCQFHVSWFLFHGHIFHIIGFSFILYNLTFTLLWSRRRRPAKVIGYWSFHPRFSSCFVMSSSSGSKQFVCHFAMFSFFQTHGWQNWFLALLLLPLILLNTREPAVRQKMTTDPDLVADICENRFWDRKFDSRQKIPKRRQILPAAGFYWKHCYCTQDHCQRDELYWKKKKYQFLSNSVYLFNYLFSSPDPKGQVSYCHHLASIVTPLT